jgi:hypothetical protein
MHDESMTEEQHPALHLVEPGESIEFVAETATAKVLVTDRRLAVAAGDRIALNITFEGLRRIQFDIERRRPATLVIVPEDAGDEPQVLAVPPDRYDEVTRALATIGRRLAEVG